jgi:hypothetical protein
MDDGVDGTPAGKATAQESQHRHGHGAQRERAGRRGEVGLAEELEDAGVNRQELATTRPKWAPPQSTRWKKLKPTVQVSRDDRVAVQSTPIATATSPIRASVKPVERSQCRSSTMRC